MVGRFACQPKRTEMAMLNVDGCAKVEKEKSRQGEVSIFASARLGPYTRMNFPSSRPPAPASPYLLGSYHIHLPV